MHPKQGNGQHTSRNSGLTKRKAKGSARTAKATNTIPRTAENSKLSIDQARPPFMTQTTTLPRHENARAIMRINTSTMPPQSSHSTSLSSKLAYRPRHKPSSPRVVTDPPAAQQATKIQPGKLFSVPALAKYPVHIQIRKLKRKT